MTHRQVVLVSGPPGAGKTSVAVPLAEALGYPLLSKDTIKETLWDALRPDPGDLAASQRIGGAAMEVLWTLAGQCPQVVLEANFRPRSDYERRQVDRLGGRVVEVHCSCPLTVALARYEDRAIRPGHHPAHVARTVDVDVLAEFDQTFDLAPILLVDTTAPVDIAALCLDVRGALASGEGGVSRRRGRSRRWSG